MGSIVSVKERARKKTMVISSFGSPQILHKQQRRLRDAGKGTYVRREREVGIKTSERILVDSKQEERFRRSKSENVSKQGNNNANNYDEFKQKNKEFIRNSPTRIGKELEPQEDNAVDENDKNIISNPQSNVQDDYEVNGIWDQAEDLNQNGVGEEQRDNNNKNDTKKFIGKISANENKELKYLPKVNVEMNCINQLASPEKTTRQLRSRGNTPVSQAIGSWGEGVVGTGSHSLHNTGHVTSRGVDADVKSSADYYNDFAHVSSYKSLTPEVTVKSKPKSHTGACLCKTCLDARRRERAAVKIQSNLRGYQARKEMFKRQNTVVKIQRLYRAKIQKRLSEGLKDFGSHANATGRADQMGDKNEAAKENFELYQDDITELKWQSQRLIEIANMGDDYEPQKILLISSNIQRPEWLARTSLRDVHVIMYQFSQVKFKDLLENIELSLGDYRVGSKAKRIAFVCQGGPGYLYICKGKVLTSKKLEKEQELQKFLKGLGNFVSKKDPKDAKVHFIGNSVLGSNNGVQLLQDIEMAMHPAKVSVESPFEISQSGYEMLNEYFNIDLYNIWKKYRYTRMQVEGLYDYE